MKTYQFGLGISLGLLLGCTAPRPACADWVVNDVMKRKASFEVEKASTDDYILAVSRAYGVNLILDSTRVPQDGPPLMEKIDNGNLWGALQFFASRHNLNARQLGDGSTILLWEQPDTSQLARDLIASGEVKTSVDPMRSRFALQSGQARLQGLLADFFAAKGWNGQRPFQGTMAFDELPREIQTRLTWQTRAGASPFAGVSPLWFSDAFWQSARIQTIQATDSTTGARVSELTVSGILNRYKDSVEISGVQLRSPNVPFGDAVDASFGAAETPQGVPVAVKDKKDSEPDDFLAQSPLAAPYQPRPDLRLDLAGEPALDTKITLETKRLPLSEVVAALGQKAGIKLTLAPEWEATPTLLTLGITQMPLREAMTSLTRLLGCEWSKAGDGYIAQSGDTSALDKRLLEARVLHPTVLVSEAPPLGAVKQQDYLAKVDAITDAVGAAALKAPLGVAFTALPPELQKQLRADIETALEPTFVESQAQMRQIQTALNQRWHVQLDVPATKTRAVTLKDGHTLRNDTPAMVRVVAENGQVLTSFPLRTSPQNGAA